MNCSLPAGPTLRNITLKELYVMKNHLSSRLILRVFTALLALCLLPAAALGTGAEVEDIDLNTLNAVKLPIDFTPGMEPKAEARSMFMRTAPFASPLRK